MKIAWWPLALLLLGGILFTACEKDNTEDQDQDPTTNLTEGNEQFMELLLGGGEGDDDDDDFGDDDDLEDLLEDFECFEFVFPIEMVFPGGETVSIADEDAFYEVMESWLELDDDPVDYPTFNFPITVEVDEEEIAIADEEELCELFYDCWEEDDEDCDCDCDDDDDDCDDDDDDLDEDEWDLLAECFEFHFPLDLMFPSGETTTVNDFEELVDTFEDWWDNNPDSEEDPEPVFPFTVTLEDGDEVIVNDFDDWEELLEECGC